MRWNVQQQLLTFPANLEVYPVHNNNKIRITTAVAMQTQKQQQKLQTRKSPQLSCTARISIYVVDMQRGLVPLLATVGSSLFAWVCVFGLLPNMWRSHNSGFFNCQHQFSTKYLNWRRRPLNFRAIANQSTAVRANRIKNHYDSLNSNENFFFSVAFVDLAKCVCIDMYDQMYRYAK